ncbi:unnamed protein product, partial [Cyprideis torosa]
MKPSSADIELSLSKSNLFWLLREQYYHTAEVRAMEAFRKFGDVHFRFLLGLALILEGRFQEGLRELERLQTDPVYGVGSILALIHGHKQCRTVDREAVTILDNKLKEERKKASPQRTGAKQNSAEVCIERMAQQPVGVAQGIAKNFKELQGGFYSGVTGIVTKPLEGARTEGVGGFLKGVGRGVVGLVVRPAAGVVDFASGSFGVVRSVTDNQEEISTRVRLPRHIREDGVVRPYIQHDAEGKMLLRELGADRTGTYVTHVMVSVKEKSVLLITDERIMLAHLTDIFSTWTVDWSYELDELSGVPSQIEGEKSAVQLILKAAASSGLGLFKRSRGNRRVVIKLRDEETAHYVVHKIQEALRKQEINSEVSAFMRIVDEEESCWICDFVEVSDERVVTQAEELLVSLEQINSRVPDRPPSISFRKHLFTCSSEYLLRPYPSVPPPMGKSVVQKSPNDRRELGLYHACLVLLLSGRSDKASDYADRLLKQSAQSVEGLTVKGWADVLRGTKGDTPSEFFDAAIASNLPGGKLPTDVKQLRVEPLLMDTFLGKSKVFERTHSFDQALSLLNSAIVSTELQKFVPPLVEKMRCQLALHDWDQAIDTADRALKLDPSCLEAKRTKVLNALCNRGDSKMALQTLKQFVSDIEKYETKNSTILVNNAQLFSRLCGRNPEILAETYKMAERAVQVDSGSVNSLVELGQQCLLQDNVSQAMKFFRSATKLDGSSLAALTGTLACQVLSGDFDAASEQLEFEREVAASSPEILLLNAFLARQKNKGADELMQLINQAVEVQFRSFRAIPFGAEFLRALNPDLLLRIARECISFAPTQPIQAAQSVPVSLKRVLSILEPCVRSCPGLKEGRYLLAKAKYLSADTKAAVADLQYIFDNIDNSFAEAHLLMAEIQVSLGHFQQAAQSLEHGLSYNFKRVFVRDSPLYHLIKARIHKRKKEYAEAVTALKQAMSLPSFKAGTSSRAGAPESLSSQAISSSDKVAIYLELVDALRLQDKGQEAAKVMEIARSEFAGTPEELRISLSQADLCLSRGDVDAALSLLKRVSPQQPFFVQSREKMAEIYLHHRKDLKNYAACYKEIVDKHPTPQNYLVYGDAFMAIQEPEKAIEIYEQALKRNPRDPLLASKMGQALIKTHQYGKAINYYREAIRNDESNQLRYDLASLQLRLRQYDKAEKTIAQALEHLKESTDAISLTLQAKLLLLLAKVQEKSGVLEAALLTLNRARDLQNRVLKRAAVESPDAAEEQRELAASICRQMAQHAVTERNWEKAIKLYKEAISSYPEDSDSLLALARLYLTVNDLDQCRQCCQTLIQLGKESTAASGMMADVAFSLAVRKHDFDTAKMHFQGIL